MGHTAVSATQASDIFCIDITKPMQNERVPSTLLIFQLSIAVENLKWHQFIAKTMGYRNVLRYINHAFWQARFNKFW